MTKRKPNDRARLERKLRVAVKALREIVAECDDGERGAYGVCYACHVARSALREMKVRAGR